MWMMRKGWKRAIRPCGNVFFCPSRLAVSPVAAKGLRNRGAPYLIAQRDLVGEEPPGGLVLPAAPSGPPRTLSRPGDAASRPLLLPPAGTRSHGPVNGKDGARGEAAPARESPAKPRGVGGSAGGRESRGWAGARAAEVRAGDPSTALEVAFLGSGRHLGPLQGCFHCVWPDGRSWLGQGRHICPGGTGSPGQDAGLWAGTGPQSCRAKEPRSPGGPRCSLPGEEGRPPPVRLGGQSPGSDGRGTELEKPWGERQSGSR